MTYPRHIRERAVEYVRGGMSYYSAAKTLTAQCGRKIYREAVRDWCLKAKVQSGDPRGLAARAEVRRRAVELVRSGKSTYEAARLTGAAKTSVARWCDKEGVRPARRAGRPRKDEEREEALELVRSGWSMNAAAKSLGLSACRVWQWCLEAGVKSRNDHNGSKVVRKARPIAADRIRAALEQLGAGRTETERKELRRAEREKLREDKKRIRETLRSWRVPRENSIRATKAKGDKTK